MKIKIFKSWNLYLILCAFGKHAWVTKIYKNGMVDVWNGEFECRYCHAPASFTATTIARAAFERTAKEMVKRIFAHTSIPRNLFGKRDTSSGALHKEAFIVQELKKKGIRVSNE